MFLVLISTDKKADMLSKMSRRKEKRERDRGGETPNNSQNQGQKTLGQKQSIDALFGGGGDCR